VDIDGISAALDSPFQRRLGHVQAYVIRAGLAVLEPVVFVHYARAQLHVLLVIC
jgi:hypothetical protein